MSAIQAKPAQPQSSNGLPSWPEQIPAALARLLVDCQWIRFYERQPAEGVAAFQFQRISTLATHAVRSSAWWSAHFKGISGRSSIALTDLPLMGRQEYRAAIQHAGGPLPLPPDHGAAIENSTSGSSGVPVAFFVSGLAARMNTAHYFHDEARQGRAHRPLLRAEIMGRVPEHDSEHAVAPGNPLLGQGMTLRRKAQQFSIEAHARWLTRVAPAYLCTAPSVLDGLLDVYEHGDATAPRIEQITSMAETVTPALRQRAKAILGASIRDRYSCEEVGPIAFQCPHSDDHYHIASTSALAEVLDDAGRPCAPGVIGRVFVTSLYNYASPVIRYELGDLAAWEPSCPCGHHLPVLTKMLGRKRFLVRLPSGERKTIRIMAEEWLAIAPFRETRLVQVSEGVLHAELVLDRPMTASETEGVLAMLRSEVSPDLIYEVKQLDRIDWGPTYKRQDVVSLV